MNQRIILLACLVVLCTVTLCSAQSNLADLEQTALNQAANAVADSVVQIRTVGGLDRVGKNLLAQGPTTGLIVSPDGYIVSSAFNFAGQPSSILVRMANGQQLAAELVAHDRNRMLVLLKVSTDQPLPVPTAVPSDEIQVGQWALALGRTFRADQVGVSVGVVSALHRMHGRVLQTDAKISVANYGGPLVDIRGRVFGVLVPMSPQSSGGEPGSELAGAEYYDSGIGFAVPLEHIFSVLDRWQQGDVLLPGKLGIGMTSGNPHLTEPKITSVWPDSPAALAGWQPDDLVLAVEGQPVATQTQLRFQILPHYADDTVRVTLQRGKEEIETEVTLTGKLAPYRLPFLGVFPNRQSTNEESEKTGALVRGVWPGSPADEAGVIAGDRITKLDGKIVKTSDEVRSALGGVHVGQSTAITIIRGEETLELSAQLTTLPDEILSREALPQRNSESTEANTDDVELQTLKLPEFSQEAVYYAPPASESENYGLLVWLGDGIAEHHQALVDDWREICQRDGLILLIAPPAEESIWRSDDLAYLQQLARAAVRQLNVDRQRLVTVGQGKAGQLAYALALSARSPFRGVIAIDAPLPRTFNLADTSPTHRRAVLTLEARDSTFAPLIRRDLEQLREAGYPTVHFQHTSAANGSLQLTPETRDAAARWLDGLDCY